MGVPKFYRWLSERYVSVNQVISDLSLLPEFDNLYLDMNGIIHACTHPNDQEVCQGLSQEEMMKNIWNYVDRIVTQIVKPQKLLYVAVDGVAPRAKMNQQRSRRFRAAKDAAEAREEAGKRGVSVDEATVFDSNCITPGTEFMAVVDAHLQYFIRKKMREDPLWRRLTIIYSGHAIPGEGEHKIMQYMRDLKASPSYQANVRHCMYGQDADLIMLALATHEPHFTLLREVIDFGRGRAGPGGSSANTVIKQTKEASFQLLHLSILREYLEFEFLRDVPEEEREVHLERIVDDFVFLTFLVGNDFLPHLPSLDISEHAFDKLFELYGEQYRTWEGQGYLTNRGEIDIEHLQAFLDAIGAMEDDILKAREEDVADFNARRRRTQKKFGVRGAEVPSEEALAEIEAEAQSKYEMAMAVAVKKGEISKERARVLLGFAPIPVDKEGSGPDGGGTKKGKAEQALSVPEPVKKNFRGRYYFEKLGVLDPECSPVVQDLCKRYAEGLAWCLAYYVKGCVSWKWFFPYHYGPLISDVKNLAGAVGSLKFELGEPFLPFEQLLSCLPAASAKFLPRRYQFLMTNPTSPIVDFYPEEFKVDMNGKHNPWEGVVLIPFIDETRLREAIKKYCPESSLTSDEKKRNSFGKILTFRHSPALSLTVPSCNPALFPDLTHSQTTVTPSSYSPASLTSFAPCLVPGTVIPLPGFPSLKVLPIQEVEIKALKVNVNGSDSRYRTICLSLPVTSLPAIETLAPEIVGRPVYVNWPMMHEARITAVTNGKVEYRLEGAIGGGEPTTVSRELTPEEQTAWDVFIEKEQKAYLNGRGTVGQGGVDLGKVEMTLKVRALQGLERCPATGSTKKVFGTHEADVPIQLAMWSVPTADPRFIEQGPVPLLDRLPLGAEVVVLEEGKLKGMTGKVVGYNKGGQEQVKVELACGEPDRPIGLLARKAFGNKFFDAGEVIRALNIDGRVLGKVTGSCFVNPGKHDLGLNLKVRSKWVLPDYVRRKAVAGAGSGKAWAAAVDVVRIVGSAETGEEGDTEPGGVPWEYSEKAVLLLRAYMDAFPRLFEELRRRPNEVNYEGQRLFGANCAAELEKIRTWLATQVTANMPRVPLTTQVLSREAIRAIERSADELQAKAKKAGAKYVKVVAVELSPEKVHCALSHKPSDVARRLAGKPELGDRVVNLTGLGVPFGLRGTVVALHTQTACVEVLFDQEFIGGTSLQGTCSPYRGKFLPWSALLKTTAAGGTLDAKREQAVHEGGDQAMGGTVRGKSGGGRQPQQQKERTGKKEIEKGGITPIPVKILTREQQLPQQEPQQRRKSQQAPSVGSVSASCPPMSTGSNQMGRDLLASLTGKEKGMDSISRPNAAMTVRNGKRVDPRNAMEVAVRVHTSKPVVSLPLVETGRDKEEGGGDVRRAGAKDSFGRHSKAKGPDGTIGFQRRRSREAAGTIAERIQEEEAKAKQDDMARVMGLLSLQKEGDNLQQETLVTSKSSEVGGATNNLKSILNLTGGMKGSSSSNPPTASNSVAVHHQQPPPAYPYPAGPGFLGPNGFYPTPPPPGYYFHPHMPGTSMSSMMPHHLVAHPQSPVIPRRPRERRSSNAEGTGGGESLQAGGYGETSSDGGGATNGRGVISKGSFIMPSQVLRTGNSSKKGISGENVATAAAEKTGVTSGTNS